ncbi:uncharacterized protein LOC107262399 [Ricinus communis]|uniref:uncharacterized protein LOC107262399 n=1 Tax=Ricinus communis TaxID=3988 RepID=UPI00077267D9|nr:uncharacterized protein LOC107262399 [Ricinus communis]|eukprot:XP_015583449.1 uncharacterized protein LOC107262399 [Ricinus communis]
MSKSVRDDVVFDILSSLPVKTLLRFRCLSKSFCSLIDSPDFINSHLNLSVKTTTNRLLLADEFTGSVYGVDVDSPALSYLDGFGCDVITNDYKVIIITQTDHSFSVMLYSLKSSSSRRIQDLHTPAPDCFPYCRRLQCVSVGSSLHWLVISRNESTPDHIILSFDCPSLVFIYVKTWLIIVCFQNLEDASVLFLAETETNSRDFVRVLNTTQVSMLPGFSNITSQSVSVKCEGEMKNQLDMKNQLIELSGERGNAGLTIFLDSALRRTKISALHPEMISILL